MRIPASLAIACLLLLTLAGCLGGSDGGRDGTAPVPPTPGRVNDLTAEGASVSREGDDLVLAYAGNLGRGAFVPLVGILPDSDAVGLQLPVDASVRTVVLDFAGTGPAALTLRDGDGNLLCASRAGRVCSAIVNASAPAHWPLLVTSLASDGVAFTLKATLSADGIPYGIDPTPPANATVFVTDEPGGEPTLAALADGRLLVASGSGVLRFHPDGTYDDVTPPVDAAADQTLDPFLVGDPETGRVYVTQLASCMRLSWTDDGGDTWVTNPVTCGGPEQHHQKIAAGPGPVAGTRSVHIATMNLASWLATEDVVIVHSASYDGGVGWIQRPAMTKETAGMEARAVGNIAAGPDGHVVYIIAYLCDRFVDAEYEGVAVGVTDAALGTWTWQAIAPGGGRCEGIDPGIATTPGGGVYAAWEDLSTGVGNVWWSGLDGDAWSPPATVPTPGLGSFVFTDLAATDALLAAHFLATPDTTLGPTQAPGWSRWYPYVATLDLDGAAATWQVRRLQEDPVQIGPICMDGPMCLGGARNLLDFIDVQVAPDGQVVMSYADGCNEGCGWSWESRGADLRVAVYRPS